MNASLLALVLASGVAAPAPNSAKIKPPQGVPPAQVIATVTKEGEFEITRTVLQTEVVNQERVVTVNGVPTKQVVQVAAVKPVQVTQRIKPDGVKVITATGKELKAIEVSDMLKKPTVVLFANDGKDVDPFYLMLIKPDTLIIVAPAPAPTVAPVPVEPKKE